MIPEKFLKKLETKGFIILRNFFLQSKSFLRTLFKNLKALEVNAVFLYFRLKKERKVKPFFNFFTFLKKSQIRKKFKEVSICLSKKKPPFLKIKETPLKFFFKSED